MASKTWDVYPPARLSPCVLFPTTESELLQDMLSPYAYFQRTVYVSTVVIDLVILLPSTKVHALLQNKFLSDQEEQNLRAVSSELDSWI